MDRLDVRRAELHQVMEDRGAWPERSPWIREAVRALPRDRFAPERLWRWDGHAYVPVDRTDEPGGWADLLFADPDAAAVTQVTGGLPTSSLSCQGIVVDMLDSLLLEPGHRVLELGTGTGWNAVLAAVRAGVGRVTTVEMDPDVGETARARLLAHAPGIRTELGDGSLGAPDSGPYDRVIATYAVEHVPWAWVAQTRPGGRVVFPWGRLGHIALTVADDGASASGWVQGLAQFMPDRTTGTEPGFTEVRGTGEPDDERIWTRELAPLRDDWDLRFALRVAEPGLQYTTAEDDDGWNAWLHDQDSSWAVIAAQEDGTTVASQGGPRRLADLLDQAWGEWTQLGSPDRYAYGLTVTPDRQYAWALDPGTGPRWYQLADPRGARA
ncbi:methyltransferase domain-containing protein [Streptomyces qinzhouensis]|uniref:Protein-L-isoaspartate O-methyltransferase n=1 Tax=Streptomyces qinzhouensis TaxID=2599401 RepID=A0A5B8JA77_9ACTN|nr:methyltransferase domain-containing protein [Streptomyces qinzhouensis]QDY78236.1 methyltransferase domain-containing protein [Streptomyces qinzhouensis]